MVLFKVNFTLIAEKFSRLTEGRVQTVHCLCVLYSGICLTNEEKAREKTLSPGSRKVPDGHESMCQHGRILRVARQEVGPRLPALRDPGKPSVSVDICRNP